MISLFASIVSGTAYRLNALNNQVKKSFCLISFGRVSLISIVSPSVYLLLGELLNVAPEPIVIFTSLASRNLIQENST